PGKIPAGTGQSVRMVDAHAVHEPLAEPAGDFGVSVVEHRAIFLPQPGQRGDREEAPVAGDPVSPAHQTVVLAVMDLCAVLRSASLPGARGDRQRQVAQPQPVAVDLRLARVVVGTQYWQHNSAAL